MRLAPDNRHCSGFTLVELMIAMLVFTMVIGAVIGVSVSFDRLRTQQEAATDLQRKMRDTMQALVRHIEEAGLDPVGSAGAGIEPPFFLGAIGSPLVSYRLRFSTDRNGNGAIDSSDNERILLNHNSGSKTLEMTVYPGMTGQTTRTLMRDVTAVSLTYLDDNGSSTHTPANVRSVLISMTAQQAAGRNTVTRTYKTRVRCRNLGL